MFWIVRSESGPKKLQRRDGRYVIHRHHDAEGDHLDLRLECDGFLMGWRIDGADLDDSPWATQKPPHSTRWLEAGEGVIVESQGDYAWERRSESENVILLEDESGCRRIRFECVRPLNSLAARGLWQAAASAGLGLDDAAALLADGAAARARAIERLCGLGRELDGHAFEAQLWRKSLGGLSLDEIHSQLRAFEVRFDTKYPPRPVSRPESLDEESENRSESALAIVRD